VLAAAGAPALAPAPATAHVIACATKKGKAKRACARRAAAHRRAHRRAAARRKSKPKAPVAPPLVVAPPDVAPTPVVAEPVAPAPPAAAPVTTWRAAGAQPLSDAEATAGVHPALETRPANAAANTYRPSAAELDLFRNGQTDRYGRTALQYNPLTAHVTGGFSGSTDEILQWVARKWGIPEDVVRAVAATESWWSMGQLGDLVDGTYQSLGIMQVRWTPQGLHPGTDPLRSKSTAFNADYWGAVVRYYYDGLCSWCGPDYAAGQAWSSIGAWYNPSPWTSGSQTYQDKVRGYVALRPWALPGF
jgi:hypothetical protein